MANKMRENCKIEKTKKRGKSARLTGMRPRIKLLAAGGLSHHQGQKLGLFSIHKNCVFWQTHCQHLELGTSVDR